MQGHLADRWAEEFPGFHLLRDPNGTTRLTGHIVDQAALHGLLRRVRDLGWPLLGVIRIDDDDAPSDPQDPSDAPGEPELPEAPAAEEERP